MFDVLDDLENAMAKVVACEIPLDVVRVNRLRNQFDAVFARTVEEYDREGDWPEEGFRTSGVALRKKCNLSHGVAAGTLHVGRKLRDMPDVRCAFERGAVSRQHVDCFAKAFTPERMPVLSEIEERLVEVARIATPKELNELLHRYTDAIDGGDGTVRAQDQFEHQCFRISKTLNGRWRGTFELDPVSGEIVNNGVNAMMGRPRKGDDRPAEERRAHAFVELIRAGIAHAKFPPGRRPRADISVHIDISEIERRDPHVALEIRQHVHGLPRATLRRLTCDCTIARVITDGPSQVLDVGRATRTVPVAMRRALEARDGGCTWENCDRPALWCDAHHIWHWEDGGPTNLDNLRLLCTYHHHKVHMQEGGPDPP